MGPLGTVNVNHYFYDSLKDLNLGTSLYINLISPVQSVSAWWDIFLLYKNAEQMHVDGCSQPSLPSD